MGGYTTVNQDELVAKQQLEIEELPIIKNKSKSACNEARNSLWRPEQWSIKCPDFPKVAMSGIIKARQAIDNI